MTASAQGGRQTTHLADTGYLLCFGGVARGLAFLRELFDGGIAAPPAVKRELGRLPSNMNKPAGVRKAAAAFTGTSSGILLNAPMFEGDVVERDLALHCIEHGQTPSPHSGQFPEAGAELTAVTEGKNAGEAEAIAVALRRGVPLLITDGPATRYARARALPTEDAAHSLRRLSMTPKEKYQIYLEMDRNVGNAGEPVKGHLWYRES